ncbi:MAG TPA: DUF5985 family protein [Nevskiaceae bacterium]|nr:DUF5985 family protein [Nevskiaceae bacterium]
MEAFVYAFIALIAGICAVLLARGYLRSRAPMLFWSALCFAGLTASNAILFADLVMFPEVSLFTLRMVVTAVSLALLVYGFIWDGSKS